MALDKKVVAAMKPYQMYNSAKLNINIARILSDVDVKVKSYRKAIEYLEYMKKNVKPDVILYSEGNVDENEIPVGEDQLNLNAVEAAGELLARTKSEMDNEAAAAILGMYKEIYERYASAETIDVLEKSIEGFENVKKLRGKYCATQKLIGDALFQQLKELDQIDGHIKDAKEKIAKLGKTQKIKLLIGLMVIVCIIAGAFFVAHTDLPTRGRAMVAAKRGDYEKAQECYTELYDAYGKEDDLAQICEMKYQRALGYFEIDKRKEAYDMISDLEAEGYKDSTELLYKIEKESILKRELGDGSHFGDYYWFIVERTDDYAVLVSEKLVVPSIAFSKKGSNSWEESDIREWLNTEFMEDTFRDIEKKDILVTDVVTEDEDQKEVITNDQVYILSAAELEDYEELLQKNQPPMWLRDAGSSDGMNAFSINNLAKMFGYPSDEEAFGIRPVIRVKLTHEK